MIKVVAKSEYYPEEIEKALGFFDEMLACSRAEEGCISYELYRSLEDPNTMTVIETWETMEALTAHRENEQVISIRDKIRPLRRKEFGVDAYTSV